MQILLHNLYIWFLCKQLCLIRLFIYSSFQSFHPLIPLKNNFCFWPEEFCPMSMTQRWRATDNMVPMHQGEAGRLTNRQITKWADDYKKVLSRMQFGIEEELQSPSSFVLEPVFEPNLEGLKFVRTLGRGYFS